MLPAIKKPQLWLNCVILVMIKNMINLYVVLISSLISIGAFISGVYKLFRKKSPLYFQLLICAVGCLALEQLYIAAAIWCNIFNPNINLGMIGLFGCNFFLFSANYGQLDSIIDDGSNTNSSARKIAFAAPIILACAIAIIIPLIFSHSAKVVLLFIAMLIPACPASYFNLKHLLMPMDDFEFLKGTRKCNLSALLFYAISVIYIYGIVLAKPWLQGIAMVMMSVSMLLVSIFAIEGAKQWAI